MIRPGKPAPGAGRRSQEHREGGQPRPGDDTRQPTAAERVRTLLESNASAALAIPGLGAPPGSDAGKGKTNELGHTVPESRAVMPSGDVLVLIPSRSPAARAVAHAQDDDVTAVMEITDVAPVAVPYRIRGRGWVAGWLTPVTGEAWAAGIRLLTERHPGGPVPGPDWTLLRLEVGEAYTDDLWGAAYVEPDELADAEPDPLARHEAELLQHMAAAHGPELRSLCALLGDRGAGCAAWEAVTPLGLDRFGLRVRFRAGSACFDARFEFPEPVRDISRLRHALRWLFEAAAAD
ncbi:DUF2470 domain-containing protein [Streptomyces sp. NBC_01803]|uniref:DUF2470 domain-containing protein n=1 Tax=Streptomyces sp. NBC_01803 TaxID=2975946 RepID=UPI002DDC7951|nr:DUF2470 domain-containing protein [Streptomyces sp. NBC_01803]WSA47158.1 DUF2470 domain-containing protein [Streptomyces sp. NBC_01803]